MSHRAITSLSAQSRLLFRFSLIGALLLFASASATFGQEELPAAVEGEEIPFDTDRGVWAFDTDGDTWPDLTEELAGTDPYDATDYSGSDLISQTPLQKELDFPSRPCRGPFTQQNNRLCITGVQNASNYRAASATCSNIGARVCDYEDLNYLYFFTANDANFNPNGKWLGHFVGDSTVQCGNRSVTFNNDPDTTNFDGTCNVFGNRTFWCCHTRN